MRRRRIGRRTAEGVTYAASFDADPSAEDIEALDAIANAVGKMSRSFNLPSA